MTDASSYEESADVAIVGMAGRFPGAANLDAFWANVCAGTESIRRFTDDELRDSGIAEDLIRDPRYVKASPALDDYDKFDAALFGYSPREAAVIDPQQRLMLESAHAALEDGGYDPERFDGRIGVFAGAAMNTYFIDRDLASRFYDDYIPTLIGSDKDYVATRISFKLNLTGPSITVQTACSTSLVAAHLACQALLNEECEMALAGGVSVRIPQVTGYLYQDGEVLTPDGHVRPFDGRAGGTLFGSGVGVVLLKRLGDAVRDRDTVYAVIKGSAVNNDGSGKANFMAPSISTQSAVIAEALASADVDPGTVDYVEAHGTGTYLGDPIEFEALKRAFSGQDGRRQYCGLGSVKGNFGHLDAAAGITGLIKTSLALKHGVLPASINFTEPNPQIDLVDSPFYVNTETREWSAAEGPRRAGVSSLGIGGTNAHIVLEEAPSLPVPPPSEAKQLLLLSANTPAALQATSDSLRNHLRNHPDMDLRDAAYTLQVGRRHFDHRRMVVAESVSDAATALESVGSDQARVVDGTPAATDLVFLFSGQGSQYVDMGRGLYESEPLFREEIDLMSRKLERHLGLDLRTLLYPVTGGAAAGALERSEVAQPALFAVEYALARLWMSWGIYPQVLAGQGIGEFVAACLAGVFSIEDALAVVAARGRLMQGLAPGALLAVPLPEDDVLPLLGESRFLAAVNGLRSCVVAGEVADIEALADELSRRGVQVCQLNACHEFRGHKVEPILAPFLEVIRRADLKPPSLPVVSSLTGTWITPEEATDPHYWARHLGSTVRLADGLAELMSERDRAFLELGPGNPLATLARGISDDPGQTVLSSLGQAEDGGRDREFVLSALGRLWLIGIEPDWHRLHAVPTPRRVPLPTYPFERRRHWIDKPKASEPARPPAPERSATIDDWLYVPSWRRTPFARPAKVRRWLVFAVESDLGGVLSRLEGEGHDVLRVYASDSFGRVDDNTFLVDPANSDDYEQVLNTLAAEERLPQGVIHLWMGHPAPADQSIDELRISLDRGVNSVLAIARALGRAAATHRAVLKVVTVGAHRVLGDENVRPEAAAVLGPCKVIPLEYANIKCRHIDLPGTEPSAQLFDELMSKSDDVTVALRGSHRWVFDVERASLPDRSGGTLRIRHGGVYVIVGGLGGIGLVLGRHLAAKYNVKLALLSRSGRPDPAAIDSNSELARRIDGLDDIEAAAQDLMIIRADACDKTQMRAALDRVETALGPINGVIFTAQVTDTAGLIHNRTPSDMEASIAPKIFGTQILDELLLARAPDFILLSSSIATQLYHNRFAQVGYVTANSFVEAYADRAKSTPIISVAWDEWFGVGMAVRAVEDFAESYGYDDTEMTDSVHSFTPEEGVEVFERALASGLPQVYVSTTDLRARIVEDVNISSPFLQRALAEEAAFESAPADADAADVIARVWQDLLGFESIGIDDDFFDLGGDSLQVARMADRLSRAFGVQLPLNLMFESPTIRQLVDAVDQVRGCVVGDTTAAEQGPVVGHTSLSPAQLRYLGRGSNPNHFNVSLLLKPREPLGVELLRDALAAIIDHHDSLRLRLRRVDGRWSQSIESPGWDERILQVVDLSGVGPDRGPVEMSRVAKELQGSLDLANGPIVRCALFNLPDGGQRLLLIIHHLACDLISLFTLLLNDLQLCCQQVSSGEKISLPPKTHSFKQWTAALNDYASSEDARADLRRWLSVAWNQVKPLPLDFDNGPAANTNESAEEVGLLVSDDLTETLMRTKHHRADELLLASLAEALGEWTRAPQVHLEVLNHGRRIISDVDLSRTNGFFLTYSRAVLAVSARSEPGALLRQIREAAAKGWILDALQQLGHETELAAIPRAEVLFNFLGRSIEGEAGSWLSPSNEDKGDDHDPKNLRDHRLAVVAQVGADGIELTFVYSANLHRRATVQRLADRVHDHLRALLEQEIMAMAE